MALNVDDVVRISDGNGGIVNAKVINIHRNVDGNPRKINVAYRTRRSNRGAWGKTVHVVARAAFGKLMKAIE